jgi:hypothetical protein
MSLSSPPEARLRPEYDQPVRRRRRRSRWSRFKRQVRHLRREPSRVLLAFLGIAALFVVVCGARIAAANRELHAAEKSFLEAKSAIAETRTDDADVALDEAEEHLRAARSAARSLPLGLIRPIPLIGSPARAAIDVAHAGDELVAAGRVINDAAASFPMSGKVGIDGHDLSELHRAAVASRAALASARDRLGQAAELVGEPATAFLPTIFGPARTAARTIDEAIEQLDNADRGLSLLADLTGLSARARLLVLSQDTMELRPTGGFVGSYGILEFDRGRIDLTDFKATEELPPPASTLDVPPQFEPGQWGLENALWWPDYPTSASSAAKVFRAQTGVNVDGVLAVDETVMADLVGVFGPVIVPGYAEPVTGEHFADRVLYEVELKQPPDNPRKLFLSRLADVVLNRVFDLKPGEVADVAGVLTRDIGERSVQLWFADPTRQALISHSIIGGALAQAPKDFLMLVESNQTAGKANRDLRRDVTYSVRRDNGDRLIARVDLRYRNGGKASSINRYYNGYLRLYVPIGSRPIGSSALALGRAPDGNYEVLERSVYVEPLSETLVSVEYELPETVDVDDYQLLWLRQPGTQNDQLTAVIDGRTWSVSPSADHLDVRADLSPNAIAKFLRTRWIARFID